MNKINYHRQLEDIVSRLDPGSPKPTLLLHVCCAPCSTSCLEYLTKHFDVTVFFYNPNLFPPEEYDLRLSEEKRLIEEMGIPVEVITRDFNPQEFYDAVKGLEREPEGGKRCEKCFRLRLHETAREAEARGFDYYTTSLTISPMKDAQLLNQIGMEKAGESAWLPSDFKKKNGYLRSTQMSAEHNLYRQNYCGCVFSKKEAEEREKAKRLQEEQQAKENLES